MAPHDQLVDSLSKGGLLFDIFALTRGVHNAADLDLSGLPADVGQGVSPEALPFHDGRDEIH